MDPIRLGLSVRALRRRRRWTQEELGRRAGLSRSAISRIERGGGDALSVRLLRDVTGILGARIRMQVLWQGEELDRLLDEDHARTVERVIRMLDANGWVVAPEVTFHFGLERGSIDVLGWHPPSRSLLVVEVKTVVADLQAMLAGLDRKARLAPDIARARGWSPATGSRLLVLPNDRTSRRRIARFEATVARALPARTVAVRRWIRGPRGVLAGMSFVSIATHAGARHRVRATAA
jgi:transcriptional regulator with XRE-family HTH domain